MLILFTIFKFLPKRGGPGSSVGIATGYELDSPGSNPGGGEIFTTCPDRLWGPPSLLYNGYRVFPEVKSGQGVTLTPQPPSGPEVKKEQSYTSTPPMARRPLQSLSACTRVHFTFTFTF